MQSLKTSQQSFLYLLAHSEISMQSFCLQPYIGESFGSDVYTISHQITSKSLHCSFIQVVRTKADSSDYPVHLHLE